MFMCIPPQMPSNSKPAALSLQRRPRTRDGVYLIAGQNMWCHYGITKPVTLLHYRAQHNTPYASTQAARVTATDRRNLLFKLSSYKHAASLWLCPLSSHPPSDCCGEVFLREYHPPTHIYTHTHAVRDSYRLCQEQYTNIYTCKHANVVQLKYKQ